MAGKLGVSSQKVNAPEGGVDECRGDEVLFEA